MNNQLKDLARVLFPIVRGNPLGYSDTAREEIDLLGLTSKPNEILCVANLVINCETIEEVLSKIDEVDNFIIEQVAKEELLRITQGKREENEAQKLKSDKEKDFDTLAKTIAHTLLNVTLENHMSFGPQNFQDYTVISRNGDNILMLRGPVLEALENGWVPVGGIHVAGPIANGKMLFSQALALPKRLPPAEKVNF